MSAVASAAAAARRYTSPFGPSPATRAQNAATETFARTFSAPRRPPLSSRLPHRLLARLPKTRRQRADAEEHPEQKIERRRSEGEDDRPEKRAGQRARGADEAERKGDPGHDDVDRERDESATERARLENVRPASACPEQTRENRGSHERGQDVVVQLGRKALECCAREGSGKETDQLGGRRNARRHEPIEKGRSEEAKDEVAEKAGEGLSRIPRKPRSTHRHSTERSEPVAKRQVAPAGGGDREISAKQKKETKHDERVQRDPDRRPSLPLFPSKKIRRHPGQ